MQMPDPTHGGQLPPVQTIAETGGGTENEMPTFHCPLWPHCDCPGGTVRPEYPGLKDRIEDDGFMTVYPPMGEQR